MSLLTVALAAGAPTAVSQASTPVKVGVGSNPDVAVDSTGTAYIVWNGDEAGGAQVHFCRLPRGAKACDRRETLPSPGGDTVTRPHVFVDGLFRSGIGNRVAARLRVLAYRYGTPQGSFDFLWSTTRLGGAFGAPVAVGTLPLTGDAAWGPGRGISVVTQAMGGGSKYQRVPLSGTNTVTANLGADDSYGGAVGLLTPQRPLAVFAGTKGLSESSFMGAGNVNDAGAWTRPSALYGTTIDTGYPHLASGPSGLWLAFSEGRGAVGLARYSAEQHEFHYPARNYYGVDLGGGSNSNFASIAQDPSGRLYVAGPTPEGIKIDAGGPPLTDSPTSKRVVDQPYGSLGQPSTTFLRIADATGTSDTHLAIARDHVGVAVWTGGSGDTTEVHAGAVDGRPPYLVKVATKVSYAKGRFDLSLRCPARVRCTGSVTITARLAGAARVRLVTLGHAKFRVKAHRRAHVRVAVGRKYRATLARGHVKRVSAKFVVRAGTSPRNTLRRSLKVVRRR